MDFGFELIKKEGFARRGVIHTPSGKIQTPAFSPVGTKAAIKALSPDDLNTVGSQVVLANTYHLYLQPGVDVIKKFGKVSKFMNWEGPTITDSGGYQVSFLWSSDESGRSKDVKISDKGAWFRSHIDGSKHLLTPEKSMQIQQVLGADIIMAFDQPMSSEFTKKHNEAAYKRTFEWEERSHREWIRLGKKNLKGDHQALFGIIHGIEDRTKSRDLLKFLLEMDFPGYAIGDETIGSDPIKVADSLDAIKDMMPDNKPLHALGLGGGPKGIFTAVERGVDIFDNTSVTRMARTGLLYIHPEDGGGVDNKFRINIKKTKFKAVKKPISSICKCPMCQDYSAAYIHHLFKSKELLGYRLASMHNVFTVHNLMQQIRNAIEKGDLDELRSRWIS